MLSCVKLPVTLYSACLLFTKTNFNRLRRFQSWQCLKDHLENYLQYTWIIELSSNKYGKLVAVIALCESKQKHDNARIFINFNNQRINVWKVHMFTKTRQSKDCVPIWGAWCTTWSSHPIHLKTVGVSIYKFKNLKHYSAMNKA